MLEKMKEIIAEQLGVEEDEISLETSFKEDLGADSLEIFHLTDAHLEILQPGGLQGFHHHGDHFTVRLNGRLLYEFGSQLGHLLQLPLKAGGIGKGISQIGETDGKLFIHKVFCGAARHGRGKIRPQNEGIALLVKKFI